jgi:hypothetical protein
MWRRIACWISKATRAQAHAIARAAFLASPHTRTNAQVRGTHTHTRARAEICNDYCFSTVTMVL